MIDELNKDFRKDACLSGLSRMLCDIRPVRRIPFFQRHLLLRVLDKRKKGVDYTGKLFKDSLGFCAVLSPHPFSLFGEIGLNNLRKRLKKRID